MDFEIHTSAPSIEKIIEALQSEETKNKVIQIESATIGGNTTHVIYISDKPIEIRQFQSIILANSI